MTLRIAVSGSSGLIGRAVCDALAERGDEVVRLVRRPVTGPGEVSWDPAAGRLDPGALDDIDAVVNLNGAGVGDRRWTPAYKRLILSSRVDSTTALVTAIAHARSAGSGPSRLVNGSAVGFYGDRGDDVLTEADGPGESFLADVVRAWESAAEPVTEAGVSLALARTGTMVLGPSGGAMQPVLRLARLGLFGPMGSGRQYWSWVSLVDEVRALLHLLDHPEITGPVNLTAPQPVRQRELAAEIGRQLGRPSFVPAPGIALRAVLGEFAGEMMASQRTSPERLLGSGFAFEHPDLPSAVAWVLGAH